MAEFLYFSRDSRVYLEKDGYLWYIPVLDGFSFSQSTNTSDIELNEMEDATGRSRRGSKRFTDSLAAAEWSFSSYARPFKAAAGASATNGLAGTQNGHFAVEEMLWAAMAGNSQYDRTSYTFKSNATDGGSINAIVPSTLDLSGAQTAVGDDTYTITVVDPDNVYIEGASWTTGAKKLATTGTSGYTPPTPGITGGMRNATFKITTVSETITNVTSVTPIGASAENRIDDITERGAKWETGDTLAFDPNWFVEGEDGSSAASIGGDVTFTFQADTFDRQTGLTDINFYSSNRAQLGQFTLYFYFNKGQEGGRLLYALENAVVNEATIDFDIDGLATINWSGFAGKIVECNINPAGGSTPTAIRRPGSATTTNVTFIASSAPDPSPGAVGDIWIDADNDDDFYINTAADVWAKQIEEKTTGTGSSGTFIRNRLTQLTMYATDAFDTDSTPDYKTLAEGGYSIPLTGGSISITNNINYLTPEELGLVNQPIEHVTGTRSVSGSLTAYLAASDLGAVGNRAKDLFAQLASDETSIINQFYMEFTVGGTSAAQPRLKFIVPLAHLEVPTHSIEDVISMEANFIGQGSTISEADEVRVQMLGAT